MEKNGLGREIIPAGLSVSVKGAMAPNRAQKKEPQVMSDDL